MRQYILCLCLCTLVLCPAIACRRAPAPTGTPSAAASSAAPQQDYFHIALDQLARLDDFDPKQSLVQTAYYLNRWMEDVAHDDAWQGDPLVAALPAELRATRPLAELAKREFTVDDVRYLREASWARSIAKWVAERPDDADLRPWLKQLQARRGEPHAYELSLAAKLFDWTVRNVQLDPLLPFPERSVGPTDKTPSHGDAAQSPPWQTTPGPGYTAFPWQTLLYGHGDAWLRARIFILLCRQQQIDAVILAFDDPRAKPRPRPWLPAVLIDDQLYLFDPALGLAIRGPQGQGIATLANVREDSSLLGALDVGTDEPYGAAEADLARVVALLDVPPEALSYRLRMFQRQPASGEPLFVTISATDLAQRIARQSGVSATALWQAPFQTWAYRDALQRRSRQEPDVMRQLMFDEMIFDTMHPLVQGRIQYFRGNFEKTPDREGAKGYFVEARVPDAIINQIESSPEIQAGLGIIRTRENDVEWQYRLQMSKVFVTGIKRTATYWLGLTHYDTGRFETAIDWLKQRTLDVAGENQWKPGARYNLSRTYEALGELESARKTLLLDDSPQRHGNLLRARYLRERLERQRSADPAAS